MRVAPDTPISVSTDLLCISCSSCQRRHSFAAMSVTTTPISTRAATPSPRLRRSPRLIVIGVLCACLGGLGGAVAWHRASHANQVLVMTRAVGQGEVVRTADVGLTSVAVDRAVATIPASQLDQIVGRHALVDLSPGQLLGSHSVGELRVAPGRARVGLRLAAGRLPTRRCPRHPGRNQP